MLLEAYRVLSGNAGKGTKEAIYKNGFFFGSGIFAGIGLNDVFRMTGSDVNYKKLMIAGDEQPEMKNVHMDEVYQYGIIGAIALISILTGRYVKEVLPMATGAALGVAWANKAERGNQALTLLPF